ncbi:hypothetical protein FA95DRAFT_1674586 [Auriscalpium vulgare]|uniref:Uncharacterized protein n=1 Tax=Auriscalpium vulgare TaxID=40419 RepID=A0ACB8S9M2_9AGAM|nr:hypothetical protein FA95DRAFT_1674586 [Auriscalpium vulgare]
MSPRSQESTSSEGVPTGGTPRFSLPPMSTSGFQGECDFFTCPKPLLTSNAGSLEEARDMARRAVKLLPSLISHFRNHLDPSTPSRSPTPTSPTPPPFVASQTLPSPPPSPPPSPRRFTSGPPPPVQLIMPSLPPPPQIARRLPSQPSGPTSPPSTATRPIQREPPYGHTPDPSWSSLYRSQPASASPGSSPGHMGATLPEAPAEASAPVTDVPPAPGLVLSAALEADGSSETSSTSSATTSPSLLGHKRSREDHEDVTSPTTLASDNEERPAHRRRIDYAPPTTPAAKVGRRPPTPGAPAAVRRSKAASRAPSEPQTPTPSRALFAVREAKARALVGTLPASTSAVAHSTTRPPSPEALPPVLNRKRLRDESEDDTSRASVSHTLPSSPRTFPPAIGRKRRRDESDDTPSHAPAVEEPPRHRRYTGSAPLLPTPRRSQRLENRNLSVPLAANGSGMRGLSHLRATTPLTPATPSWERVSFPPIADEPRRMMTRSRASRSVRK